ncbi:MAG: hypothetical protein ACOC1F_03050, partial [Myxococcota bacterium]
RVYPFPVRDMFKPRLITSSMGGLTFVSEGASLRDRICRRPYQTQKGSEDGEELRLHGRFVDLDHDA